MKLVVPFPFFIAPVLDSLVFALRLDVSRLPGSAAFALDEVV